MSAASTSRAELSEVLCRCPADLAVEGALSRFLDSGARFA